MNTFLGLLIALFTIILAILILVLYIVHKIKKAVGKNNWNQMKHAIKDQNNLQMESLRQPKNVIGMTKLVLPRILEDYPDFSEQMLYNKVEADLNAIFQALEDKVPITSEELDLVQEMVNAKIEDLVTRKGHVAYDDIKFHRHAIKSYRKEEGISKIETSSTVEYYYKNDKQETSFESIKKQTRYTCEYICIYDYQKARKKSKNRLFILSCPNCGAPLDQFEDGNCSYCMAHVGQEKLKIWRLSSYREDYR